MKEVAHRLPFWMIRCFKAQVQPQPALSAMMLCSVGVTIPHFGAPRATIGISKSLNILHCNPDLLIQLGHIFRFDSIVVK
jgi:hypothetical protein